MVEPVVESEPAQNGEGAGALPVLALVSLALGSFAIGCTEFAAVALLPQIAVDLGVSQSTAGQLVTLNALAVVIAAPLLGAVFAKSPPRLVAACTLLVFALAHVMAVVSDSFAVVATTRLLSGASFGLYLAVAFAAATRLAGSGRRASGMAVVQGGITASTALGVPAGLALGRVGGDAAGWRLPFLVIAALALLAAVAVVMFVPRLPADAGQLIDVRSRLGVLRRGRVVLGLMTTAVFWGGSFGGLTYLVAYLEEEVRLTSGAVIVVLFVAGALSVVGNFVGGAAADRSPALALVTSAAGALIGLVLLFGFDSAAVVMVGLVLWQLATWSFVPVVQARVYQLGGSQGEAAVSYSVAAFNLGIVAGALLGGWALEVSGFTAVGIVSAGFALIAVGLAVAVNRVLVRENVAGPRTRCDVGMSDL